MPSTSQPLCSRGSPAGQPPLSPALPQPCPSPGSERLDRCSCLLSLWAPAFQPYTVLLPCFPLQRSDPPLRSRLWWSQARCVTGDDGTQGWHHTAVADVTRRVPCEPAVCPCGPLENPSLYMACAPAFDRVAPVQPLCFRAI